MSPRAFLEKMEAQDEIVHITDEISPRFEISPIMEAFPGGPVLSFENVEGYSTKVVGNVCATRSRICSALEVPLEGLYGKLLDALRSPVPPEIVLDSPHFFRNGLIEVPTISRNSRLLVSWQLRQVGRCSIPLSRSFRR